MNLPKERLVLICDDERHILRLIQVNLERQGYQVVCANDGEEAIERLGAGRFAVAVIDSAMPKVDGYGVLKKWIRTHEETASMNVIIMLSEGSEIDAWMQLPYLADRYIAKPFNPGSLFW